MTISPNEIGRESLGTSNSGPGQDGSEDEQPKAGFRLLLRIHGGKEKSPRAKK